MKTLIQIPNNPCNCHRCDHCRCCRSRYRQRKETDSIRDCQKTQGNHRKKIGKQNRVDKMANREDWPIFRTSSYKPQSPLTAIRSSRFVNLKLLGRTRSIAGICGPQLPEDLEPPSLGRAMRPPGITNLKTLGEYI